MNIHDNMKKLMESVSPLQVEEEFDPYAKYVAMTKNATTYDEVANIIFNNAGLGEEEANAVIDHIMNLRDQRFDNDFMSIFGEQIEESDYLNATSQEHFNKLSREEQVGLMNTLSDEDPSKFKYGGRTRANMEKWHQQNIDNDTWPDPTKAEWGLSDYWKATKAGWDAVSNYEPEPFEPEPDNWEAVPKSFEKGDKPTKKYPDVSVSKKAKKSNFNWDDSGKDWDDLTGAEKAEVGKSLDEASVFPDRSINDLLNAQTLSVSEYNRASRVKDFPLDKFIWNKNLKMYIRKGKV